MTPFRETRPIVGFRPVRFCRLAGLTMEPPVWVPMEDDAIRPATAQAGPVDEPPGSMSGLSGVQALTVVIMPLGVVARVVASGPICPLPSRMPPAALRRATAVASVTGTKSLKMKEFAGAGGDALGEVVVLDAQRNPGERCGLLSLLRRPIGGVGREQRLFPSPRRTPGRSCRTSRCGPDVPGRGPRR